MYLLNEFGVDLYLDRTKAVRLHVERENAGSRKLSLIAVNKELKPDHKRSQFASRFRVTYTIHRWSLGAVSEINDKTNLLKRPMLTSGYMYVPVPWGVLCF